MRRHLSILFLLSYSGHPFLSHLTIDSFSVLTCDPIPGIFEFGSQTLVECFLGSFLFDKQTCKLGGTFGSTKSQQESHFLTFSDLSSSDRSFSSSFGRHDGNEQSQGCWGCFYDLTGSHIPSCPTWGVLDL